MDSTPEPAPKEPTNSAAVKQQFRSISDELRREIVLALSVALGIVLLGVFIDQCVSFHRNSQKNLTTIAQLIGNNSRAALAFDDREAAKQRVESASEQDSITSVILFGRDGKELARYQRPSDRVGEVRQYILQITHRLFGREQVTLPVRLQGEQVGSIFVESDLGLLIDAVQGILLFVGLIFLFGFALSRLITRRVERGITGPLLDLVAAAGKMKSEADLHPLQISKRGSAEVQELVHAFNQLGQRIRSQAAIVREEKAKVEEALKVKSQFLGNMSHELRTPLNGIIGMTGLVLDSGLNDDQRECLELSMESSYQLLRLVEDVLDFSAFESGNLDLRLAAFEIRARLEVTLKLLRLKAEDRSIQLDLHVHPKVPTMIVADGMRLIQVVNNLVVNAIKFSDAGRRVEVMVDVTKTEGCEAWIRFRVSDEGIGIEPDRLEQIFERFYQIDFSDTREHGGVGLGLSICKSIVDLMGGEIDVQSTPGEGSTFMFVVPCIVVHEKIAMNNRDIEQSHGLGSGNGDQVRIAEALRGKTILVTDDNATSRIMIRKKLVSYGIKVLEAKHGQEALDIIEAQPVDTVLMDCRMPVMDGFVATSRIRAHADPRVAHTPVIAVTAFASKNDENHCYSVGMNGYLAKPLDLGQLMRRIVECLATKEHPDELAVAVLKYATRDKQ